MNDRLTYTDEFTKYDEPVVDEMVMHNAMVHLEQLTDHCYMLIADNEKHHWHLTIHSRSGRANVIARVYEEENK